MPAVTASRSRELTTPRSRDSAPPAKKTKLAQAPTVSRKNGLGALVPGAFSSSSSKKPTARINAVKDARRDRVDDTTAMIGGGQSGLGDVDMDDMADRVIEISSAEEDSEDSLSDEEATGPVKATVQQSEAPAVNGLAGDDDGNIDREGTVDPEDLSFGDRLRTQDPDLVREPHVVDVESAFTVGLEDGPGALAATANRSLTAPNAQSLGTVLTQALRTNDSELLESCLRVIDVDTIYATVERLPSPLVGVLLQKLAERLHKKPGRAGMLMVWVQWSLAAHGGYLASQPHLVKQLATLNKVLRERASGLQPLLSLKGRLDMLQAQLELRKRNQRRAANDDEDDAVIYVEGEDDYASSNESDDALIQDDDKTPRANNIRRDSDDEDADSIDEMPTAMEADTESFEGSEDSDDLLDDEAEETDDDSGEDMSEPEGDDFDDGEGLSESEDDSKPARRSTAARAGLKGRR